MSPPAVSVVIPARDEGPGVRDVIDGIRAVLPDAQVLTVVDTADDKTLSSLPRDTYWVQVSEYEPGPANAIRYGISHVTGRVVVVMMADGSDDPSVLPELVRQVQLGAVIACASRYMKGGHRYGGSPLKGLLSRAAGLSMYHLARAGTHDATNAYKAYSADFLKRACIDSEQGFEMGIEMVAKATVLRERIAEVPVTWRERTDGVSHFRIREWLPAYLFWWRYAFGAKVLI